MPKSSTIKNPQYQADELFITPFGQERVDEGGVATYRAIEKNLQPTGIHVMDDYLRELSFGRSSRKAFCKRWGIPTQHLNALVSILTGMNGDEFRYRIVQRNALLLLRHTDLSPDEVAQRSGIGSTATLFRFTADQYGCTPTHWRKKYREKGDLDRYQL